jgi:hypothetical protein
MTAVHVQYDFLPGGALAVPQCDKGVFSLNRSAAFSKDSSGSASAFARL